MYLKSCKDVFSLESIVGTVCLRMQVNPVNKEFKVRVPPYLTSMQQCFFVGTVVNNVSCDCDWLFKQWLADSEPSNLFAQDLPPERAFADFVLINLVLHLVIMNFLG